MIYNFYIYEEKPLYGPNTTKGNDLLKEIDKIKYIQQRTKLFNSDRNVNDAEHS